MGVASVLLITRVGVLAGICAAYVWRSGVVVTTVIDAWYAPYAIAALAILLALAAYGFWVALAGQPLFRDLLAERPAEVPR